MRGGTRGDGALGQSVRRRCAQGAQLAGDRRVDHAAGCRRCCSYHPAGCRRLHPEKSGGVRRRRGRALRHDLRIHQVDAWQRCRCDALLVGEDDSRRGRSALHCPPHRHPCRRGRWLGRPDGFGAGQRGVPSRRVHRLARGADTDRRGRHLHRRRQQEQQRHQGHRCRPGGCSI